MTSGGPIAIIGSGINGLVAGALLAKAGRRVVVFEREARPGGLVATEPLTLPGYLHDTFSSWHGTFLGGPAWPLLAAELRGRGLRWRAAEDVVTATVRRDGDVVLLHRDPERTAAGLPSGDGRAYLAELARIRALAPHLGGILNHDPRSPAAMRGLLGVARTVGLFGMKEFVRDALSSGHGFASRRFAGGDVEALLAPWLLHAGLAPGGATGGVAGMLMLSGLHRAGLPVLEGGAGRLAEALRGVIEDHGGEVRVGAEVTRVKTKGRRVGGVVAAGRFFAAGQVLASVTPRALYGGLLADAGAVPARVRAEASRFRHGRAAMQIHLALTEPLAWRRAELGAVPLVHLCDGGAGVALACAEAEAGLLPAHPTIVVGQQYVLDPSRVPPGGAALWIQLQEVPRHPTGDAADRTETLDGWTPELVERYTGRVLDRIEAHAPGLRARIAAMAVLPPAELERRDVNLVDGDPYGGATDLDQNLVWRPLGSTRSHRTPVKGLWHIGASTHPGPGLAGASGYAAAADLLGGPQRLRTALRARA
ncbi:FAD-dependent oxidoreductase [Sphaerisporangium siamense]|uniref:Pyridine nucleotide-disulfide oxidoreductase domain-containing protein 2 n=1 Tax=Sphaerisporangium siamense TaxID=795645 RepID=A0A7W7DBE9_9ACTN|nr:NAD(P)/FAD-dependent oxidoreductase [Sphaerisporangium siamense]MBB4703459.1 phytoene dehydrogenase-like protein [Sphaerisporangium siamense]GII87547.1 FAD-dependent oxidoreductase [Sphaerisporangium siamense]